MQADMPHRWYDGVIYAPAGFLLLARTGNDLLARHRESGRTARVSGTAIKLDGSAESVQRALNYACAEIVREIESDAARLKKFRDSK